MMTTLYGIEVAAAALERCQTLTAVARAEHDEVATAADRALSMISDLALRVYAEAEAEAASLDTVARAEARAEARGTLRRTMAEAREAHGTIVRAANRTCNAAIEAAIRDRWRVILAREEA
jgi:hypothetical protein